MGFSLVAARRGRSLVVLLGFSSWGLLLWPSMGSGVLGLRELWRVGLVVTTPRPWSTGSIVVAQGLRCSGVCASSWARNQTHGSYIQIFYH